MHELMTFENPAFGRVRTLTIEEEPWFVGKDIAEVLGYESPSAAVSKKVARKIKVFPKWKHLRVNSK